MKIELKSGKNTLKVNVIKETTEVVTIEFLKNKRLVKKLLKNYTPRQVIYILEDMFKAELQAITIKVLENDNGNDIDFSDIDLSNYKVNHISGEAGNYKYYNFTLDLQEYDLGWDVANSVSVSNIVSSTITYKAA